MSRVILVPQPKIKTARLLRAVLIFDSDQDENLGSTSARLERRGTAESVSDADPVRARDRGEAEEDKGPVDLCPAERARQEPSLGFQAKQEA